MGVLTRNALLCFSSFRIFCDHIIGILTAAGIQVNFRNFRTNFEYFSIFHAFFRKYSKCFRKLRKYTRIPATVRTPVVMKTLGNCKYLKTTKKTQKIKTRVNLQNDYTRT